jgi:hypothetical protein
MWCEILYSGLLEPLKKTLLCIMPGESWHIKVSVSFKAQPLPQWAVWYLRKEHLLHLVLHSLVGVLQDLFYLTVSWVGHVRAELRESDHKQAWYL